MDSTDEETWEFAAHALRICRPAEAVEPLVDLWDRLPSTADSEGAEARKGRSIRWILDACMTDSAAHQAVAARMAESDDLRPPP